MAWHCKGCFASHLDLTQLAGKLAQLLESSMAGEGWQDSADSFQAEQVGRQAAASTPRAQGVQVMKCLQFSGRVR